MTARASTAAHATVVIAQLRRHAMTAVLRGHEHPPARFWALALLGAVAGVGFAAAQSGGAGGLHGADLLLLAAVVAAALGYVEGGLLARELGSWQTVSWALVLCSPVMLGFAALSVPRTPLSASPAEWAAFAYLAVVSMFLGFFA